MGKRLMFILLVVFVGLASGCKPGDYNLNTSLNVRDASPEEKARAEKIAAEAEATRIQNELQAAKNSVEVDALKKTADQDLEARRQKTLAEIQAGQERAEAEAATIKAQGQAQVYSIQTKAQAEATQTEAVGKAKATSVTIAAWAFVIIVTGLALSLVVLAVGRSTAHVKQAWAMSSVLSLQQGRNVPPLLIIGAGRERYLIDTFSGARARLGDPAAIDKLRMAVLARMAEATTLADVARQIGLDNRGRLSGGVSAADVLPGISASVPQMVDVEGDHAKVQ